MSRDRWPNIDIARSAFDDHAGFEAKRKEDEQWGFGRFAIDLARVPLETTFTKGLAVVGCDHNERIVCVTEIGQRTQ